MQNDFKDVTLDSTPFLSLRDLAGLYISRWYLFVLSSLVALGVVWLYLMMTPNFYTRTAEILIKEDGAGAGSLSGMGGMGDLSSFGLSSSATNVANEMRVLSSLSLSEEVVERLGLDVEYYTLGPWRKELLYGAQLPIAVVRDSVSSGNLSFEVELLFGGRVELDRFEFNGRRENYKIEGSLGEWITTPFGGLRVDGLSSYESLEEGDVILVKFLDLATTAKTYVEAIDVSKSGKESTTLLLSLSDLSPLRAEEYLATLISIYNENWIEDRNQISRSTDNFIAERLEEISQSLSEVDQDISSFKSENRVPDISLASSIYMEQSSRISAESVELAGQISLARYIKESLLSEQMQGALLPVNLGLEAESISEQIVQYNELLSQRNRLAKSSSSLNPLVLNLDGELSALREAIVAAVDNQIVILESRLASLNRQDREALQHIIDNPKQAKELLSVGRQQSVMEAIYLYLLQKREENQLSQAFAAYNTRVVNPPSGSGCPSSPDRRRLIFLALLVGLALPAVVLYLMEIMATMVRDRRDVECLTIPFVGEIPEVHAQKGGLRGLFKRPKVDEESSYFVVKPKSRNVVNEAFRIARTNIEFILRAGEGSKVIMTTSLNAGSGKSFVTLNLATTFAIKGSRVLIVDLDIRKATTSGVMGQASRGISDYLNHSEDDLLSLIERGQYYPTLDLIPVGTIPPNPTELLLDPRLAEAFERLRREYDYIFVDCPPSEIVADVAIINDYTDMTLYVARVGHIERVMLREVDRFYREQKYKNLALLLNGTPLMSRSGYGSYGYGYGYISEE